MNAMSMKSEKPGSGILQATVENISENGFWIFLGDREVFVPFADFPWFSEATVAKILEVQRPSHDHLYWPALDIDLSLASIEHPERFPLLSRP